MRLSPNILELLEKEFGHNGAMFEIAKHLAENGADLNQIWEHFAWYR